MIHARMERLVRGRCRTAWWSLASRESPALRSQGHDCRIRTATSSSSAGAGAGLCLVCPGFEIRWIGRPSEPRIFSGGLGPYEGLGVLVPGRDPFAIVGFEGLRAAVVGALQKAGGDVAEEPLDQASSNSPSKRCSMNSLSHHPVRRAPPARPLSCVETISTRQHDLQSQGMPWAEVARPVRDLRGTPCVRPFKRPRSEPDDDE